MVSFLQLDRLADDPDRLIGFLGIIGLSCCGLWLLIRWLFKEPTQPDPWGAEINAELAAEEATPLCHRCLFPHDQQTNFCPECGAPVGTYTNLLPYPYLFSIGHALRLGTEGKFRHSPLTVAGFLLFGFAEYSLFAPVYWFVFLKKLLRPAAPDPQPPDPAPEA
jgi:hypothetical protein